MRAFGTRCPFRRLTALAAFLAMTACMGSFAHAQDRPGRGGPGGTGSDRIKHREAMTQDASVVRHYTFDGIRGAADLVPNLAGDRSGPLSFHLDAAPGAAQGDFSLAPGLSPGRSAVHLDQGYFAAPAPEAAGRAFTAVLWFRKLGQGAHRGNDGSTTGMLLAMGNGYYEGWRVTTAYPSRRIKFEIGRPEGAAGCETEAVADGVWHHLAATWDGREMHVYLDGELAASGAYAGPYTPPGGTGPFSLGQFRIGYAGSGVGSVVMDVGEAALYRSALSPEEVFQDAYRDAAFTDDQRARWAAANAAAARQDDAAARRDLAALLASPSLNPDLAALARLRLADLDRRSGANLSAAAHIQTVLGTPSVAARLHRQASEKLLALLQESGGTPLPRSLYERLLSQPETTLEERLTLRLNLGHSLVASKDYAGARAQYGRIAAAPDAPAAWRRLARLCAARTWVRVGDYVHAQAAFAQIKRRLDAPPGSVAARAELAEAEEGEGEASRLRAGLPAADPRAGRVRLPKQPAPGRILYVAPNGSDAGGGTLAQPFATLERARDAIRTLKAHGGLPAGGVRVVVRGGTYRLRETFALSAQDSGDALQPIVYQSAPGETPVFDAGARVRGFAPVRDPAVLTRLPSEASGRVLQTDLKAQGITDLGAFEPGGFASARGFKTHPLLWLYFNGAAMPLAGWPDNGFVSIAAVAPGAKDTFTYAEDRPARWVGEKDAWLYGYWFYNWADSYEKIAAIETQRKTITLAPPVTTYGDGTTGFVKGRRYRAVNVLSELDQPGEWYLDRDTGLLYFYPPSDPNMARVEVSVFDGPALNMQSVSHVTLKGLTWQNGRGDGIFLKECASCLLAGCTVRGFGGNGAQIVGGRGDGLLSCDLNMLGRGGTVITGGDRRTLTPSGHFIENCHIHHFSLLDHTYTPAVLLSGVGNRIAHNLFHDATSSALRIEGNDNVIEYNDVGHVLGESDDQGASDMWANPTYRGNVFRYNYWHDMGSGQAVGQAGIRLDDWISGVRIYGNIFRHCAGGGFGGIQINQGADNLIENNLFVDCQAAVSGGAGSPEGWQRFLSSDQGRGYLQEVRALQPPYVRRYPELTHLGQDPQNSIARSVILNCGTFLRNDQRLVLRDNSVGAFNPGFKAPERGDFSVKPGTPLWNRLSFQPIPLRQIGLYGDAYRNLK